MSERREPKILSIEDLADAVERARRAGRTIALCHGVFDLVHPGHIRHLKAASEQADVVVVTVTGDRFVNKGPGRPVYHAPLRAETLASLEFVDYVAINEASTAVDVIARLKPNVYVKGSDYADPTEDVTGMIVEERRAVEAAGGRVHFTDEIVMSSSELLNAYFDVFRPETQRWIKDLRARHPVGEIVSAIGRLADLKVLVIGEAIIDEYVFCEVLGRSTKDPILAFRFGTSETHAGGSLAVANHLAGLCGEVRLVTLLGERDSREHFVKERLHPKIDLTALRQLGAPTIHKRRYVDTHTGSKVFELYTLDDAPVHQDTETAVLGALDGGLGDYDLVVVADYGHGMMTGRVVEAVSGGAKFLAVNAQSNAGNRGFNTISKYPRADYACLNGGEVRLEMRSRDGEHAELVKQISERMDCGKFTVTMGRDGTLHYDRAQGLFEAPALALSVTDRVGAGDAVLAVTAPMVALDMPWELVGFLGNLAGAEAVAEIGNSRVIDAANLIKHVKAMLG